jgi:hypothetical protein
LQGNEKLTETRAMTHDTDYFRRRAAEARAAAHSKEQGESVEVAGDLALAYSALARRRAAAGAAAGSIKSDEAPAIKLDIA